MPGRGICKVNHTGFTVSDLGRAAAFFRDVFGYTISETTRQSGLAVGLMVGIPGAEVDIVFATLGDSTIELICYINPRSDRVNDLRHCDTGFAHIAFHVDDIDSVVGSVQAAGYRLYGDPQIVPAGPRKASHASPRPG